MDDLKNLLITGLSIGLTVALGFMGYVYTTQDITPKNQATTKMQMQEPTFDSLAPSIQDQYMSKSEHLEELRKVELEKEQLSQKINDIAQANSNEDLLQKTALMQKENDEMIMSGTQIAEEKEKISKQYKTYTCKSFEKGSILVPKSCKKELYAFLDTYKTQAHKFEVIGMVDDTEFKLIRNLEDVYGSSEVKEVKKYVQIGLSRQRVIETTWLAKQHINNAVKVSAVNYTVYSDDKRGFVIRAYF